MTPPKSILTPSFRYTKVEDQGPHYLERKFARLRRELREQEKPAATVSQIKPRIKPKAA